ncbi:hypothetical protein ATANTOWER_000749 [Ataeniobius toweri]|uniref:Uncharacterized protein n=1 Tax=Ataeniobius toweri TaxID=208326 RepID=A0ABU7AVP9_9TELE|nr:hypothetical protein [Ataeniobius toweri]
MSRGGKDSLSLTNLNKSRMCSSVNSHPCSQPSIVFCLSRVGSRGKQHKQRDPDFPLPSHLGQLVRGNPKASLGQPRNIVPPACPGSFSGPPPSETCPEHLTRKASRRHPNQMPEPSQLAPLDMEKQRLY